MTAGIGSKKEGSGTRRTEVRDAIRSSSISQARKAATVVALLVWFPLLCLHLAVVDPDLWWHMRTGEWIVQHHAFPHTDPFSITGAGHSWVAYSWLFELLVYWVGKIWDLVGLDALRAGLGLITIWAFYHLLRRSTPSFWRAAAVCAVGGFALMRALVVRPGVLSVIFFIVEFAILWEADRSGRRRPLWLLPPLLCLWANVHAQFVYGLFLLGLFAIEPAANRLLRRRDVDGHIPPATLWGVLGASFAATLVNPYAWGVYRVILAFGHDVWSTRYITEMGPLSFADPGDYAALFLGLGAAFVLGRSRSVRPLWVVLLAWSAVFAFRQQRDVWLLVIVASVLLAAAEPFSRPGEPLDRRSRLATIAAVLAIVVLAWQYFSPTNKNLLSNVATRMPLGAVAYVREHRLPGPLFNDFNWGGFLIYALPEEKVAIDGRINVHGSAEMRTSMNTWGGGPGWQNDPLLQRANMVIADPSMPLTQLLKIDAHWRPVFDDGVALVFQRVK